ncbi:MAG: hypothetical protein ABIG96_05825 [Candidatus Micrarchaeota archaeon]
MEFQWPSKAELKSWIGYTELPLSYGNPKKLFENIDEMVQDLGYSVETSPYSHKVGGWEDVGDIDGRILALRKREREEGYIPEEHRFIVTLIGIAGIALIILGILGNAFLIILLGIILLIPFILLHLTKKYALSEAIVILCFGEVRKGSRERKINEKISAEKGSTARSIQEVYLTSDLSIRIGGQANYSDGEKKVKEDIKELTKRIEKFI